MPKRNIPLQSFKGIFTNSDIRQVPEGHLRVCQNMSLRRQGLLETLGSLINHAAGTATGAQIASGYGLFAFRTDRALDGSSAFTEFIILINTDGSVDIWEDDGTPSWNYNHFDISVPGGVKGIAYYIDGALRVLDASGESDTPYWFGYIDHTHVNQSPANAWYAIENVLAPPAGPLIASGSGLSGIADDTANSDTNTIASSTDDFEFGLPWDSMHVAKVDDKEIGDFFSRVDDSQWNTSTFTTTWDNISWVTLPPEGQGFNIDLGIESGTSLIPAGEYEFAQTFIYKGGQESLPSVTQGTLTIGDSEYINHVTINGYGEYNKRIIGARIYTRQQYSGDEWRLLVDIDMAKGVRPSLFDTFTAWANHSGYTAIGSSLDTEYFTASIQNIASLENTTYESINGFSQDIASIDASDRLLTDVAIVGRRGFGISGDNIYYTPVGRFDTFPEDAALPLGVNDGEEYIRILGYNDRLFAFKNHTLYIINVESANDVGWYREDTRPHLGIDSRSAAVLTPFGVAWVNENGCYLFGQQLNELSLPIDNQEWADIISANASIGYDPREKQIIIFADVGSTANNTAYIYNIQSQDWITAEGLYLQGADHSGFVVDSNGALLVAQDSGTDTIIKQLSHVPVANADIDVQTHDLDFGDPGMTKKVYGVVISYDVNADTSDILQYRLDGESAWTTVSHTLLAANTNAYIPIASGGIECQSIQLRIRNSAAARLLTIHDLTIVVRPLTAKRVS